VITRGHKPWKPVPIPVRHGLAAPVRPVLTGRPVRPRTNGWLHKGATLRRSCQVVRPKFYGEGGILVAEGGSPDRGKERPSVGAFELGLPVRGDGTSLNEVGLALLQEAGLYDRATFLPRRRYQEWKVAPAYGVAALRVFVDEEGECLAWWPGEA